MAAEDVNQTATGNTAGMADAANQNAAQQTQQPAAEAGAVNVDPAEVERIANERSERATRAALRSYFQQQGLTEEQAAEAITQYRAAQEQRAAEERNNLQALQQKLDTYEKGEAELFRRANARLIRADAVLMAGKLGIRPDRIDAAIRVANLSGVTVDEQGAVDETALKTALEEVTKQLPEFLTKSDEGATGFKLGAPGQSNSSASGDALAKIFGNK